MKLFLKRDLHVEAGKKHLFRDFYHSIENDSELPIPYREITLTYRIMDDIFGQLPAPTDD